MNLTVFVNYSRQFSRPINEISMQVNTIFSALAGAERVFTVMDAPAEEADMPDAVEMDDVKGEVTMEHVTFGYNPDKTILKAYQSVRPRRTEGCLCWFYRSRKDHHYQPFEPFLRHSGGIDRRSTEEILRNTKEAVFAPI